MVVVVVMLVVMVVVIVVVVVVFVLATYTIYCNLGSYYAGNMAIL